MNAPRNQHALKLHVSLVEKQLSHDLMQHDILQQKRCLRNNKRCSHRTYEVSDVHHHQDERDCFALNDLELYFQINIDGSHDGKFRVNNSTKSYFISSIERTNMFILVINTKTSSNDEKSLKTLCFCQSKVSVIMILALF